MIACPECQSRTEGLEGMQHPRGTVLYCPDCGWVDEQVMPYPIQEIRIKVYQSMRVELKEVRDE